jgi:hypothetical protein
MKKILLYLSFTTTYTSTVLSQMPSLGFAVQSGGETREKGNKVATDALNNYFVTGYFETSMSFSGSSTITLNSAGNYDIFLAKYNTSGQALWAFSLGTATEDIGQAVATDAAGNVYLAGYYTAAIDLDPGAGVATHPFAGIEDFFIAKYDGNGNYIWSKSYNGTDIEAVKGITVDGSGNVIAIGAFKNTVDFNPGGTADLRTSAGNYDIFILKLDPSGNMIFANTFGASSSDAAESVSIDLNDNIVVAGYFRNTIDADPGAGTTPLTSAGSSDVFLAKYNSTGDLLWAGSIGNVDGDGTKAMTVDSAGDIILTTYFSNILDADFTTGTANINSAGDRDISIIKYSSVGLFQWAKKIGGADDDRCYGVTSDHLGNIYLTGYFNATADFNPDAAIVNITSTGYKDIFVAKYDVAGSYVWAFKLGGDDHDEGFDLVLDSYENLVVTGYFYRTSDFDPGASNFNLTSFGPLPPVSVSDDVFLAKYSSSPLVASVNTVSPTCYNGNNGSATVDISGGIAPYSAFWSTGTPGNSVMSLSPGSYYVTVTDAVSNSVVVTFDIYPPAAPEICLVTVDSTTGSFNTIVWEKSSLDLGAIDSFYVYREISSVFQKIAAVHKDSLSQYDDLSVNTGTTSYLYKISALDSCGGESALSLYHKTIHMLNIGGAQFSWNFYEIEGASNPVANYLVHRDDNNTGNFLLLADGTVSGSSNSYTDINGATFPNARYRVEVDWNTATSCTSTRAINHNTTRSNKQSGITANAIATNELENLNIVYPNPASDFIFITGGEPLFADVYDCTGKLLIHEALTTNKNKIFVGNLPAGTYHMLVTSAEKKTAHSVIISR